MKDKIKKMVRMCFSNSFVVCGMVAMVLDYIIETLSRHSVIEATKFIIRNPFTYLCNVLIIMLTMLIGLLFRRRIFAVSLIAGVWFAFGVTNCLLLMFRITPFSVVDFSLVKDAFYIMSKYFDYWSVVLIVLGVVLFSVGIIILWVRTPKVKERIQYVKVMVSIVAWGAVTVLATDIGVQAEAISSDNENIADFYESNGFVYCFSSTLIDNGIKKPVTYSQERVEEFLESSKTEKTKTSKKPNIIMVQLESFFDVNYLDQVEFSENPVPIFAELKENYTSGFLTVPVVGAGTANTEFEVLTGMSLDYFGTGEYPYKTILREETCETINYNLKELGYSTHALHNNEANFYGRNTVFSSLGFDTFTSIEYMKNVETNPIDWAKDKVLTDEILAALESTKTKDFVYTIAVQSHGKYPAEVVDENQKITIEGLEGDEKNRYEYFVNQVYEVDQFVGELVKSLEEYDEDTVLVLYGDHLPNIDMEQEDLTKGNMFQTEYVIWDNFSLEQKNRDLEAYQLSAYVQEVLSYHEGTLTNYHQNCSGELDYEEGLEMLQYDMLYGDAFVYSGEKPFVATQLQMGVREIIIEAVQVDQGKVCVTGQNFTEYSVVYIDDKRQETVFVDSETLIIEETEFSDKENTISVSQVGEDQKILSTVTY